MSRSGTHAGTCGAHQLLNGRYEKVRCSPAWLRSLLLAATMAWVPSDVLETLVGALEKIASPGQDLPQSCMSSHCVHGSVKDVR